MAPDTTVASTFASSTLTPRLLSFLLSFFFAMSSPPPVKPTDIIAIQRFGSDGKLCDLAVFAAPYGLFERTCELDTTAAVVDGLSTLVLCPKDNRGKTRFEKWYWDNLPREVPFDPATHAVEGCVVVFDTPPAAR